MIKERETIPCYLFLGRGFDFDPEVLVFFYLPVSVDRCLDNAFDPFCLRPSQFILLFDTSPTHLRRRR
jgi:hypothetical protein